MFVYNTQVCNAMPNSVTFSQNNLDFQLFVPSFLLQVHVTLMSQKLQGDEI